MAINYAKLFRRFATPQYRPIPGSTQIPNSAGGFTWEADDWTRMDRFLILGAENGTFYIQEHNLVAQNHDTIIRCIKTDGVRVVNRIVEISQSGRAPKNDPAIFALALVTAHGTTEAKTMAFASLSKVCRTGTHLFHFAEYVNTLRGWGRGLRKAVGRWYVEREPKDLAYQVVKYQQRDQWSHADLLRLAHPKAPSREHDAVFRWTLKHRDLGERTVTRRVNGGTRQCNYPATGELPAMLNAFEMAKQASSKAQIVKLIEEQNLPREAIPTKWLSEAAVWDALLQHMPMTAMIRNLGKMTALELVKPFSETASVIAGRLTNETALKRARIHPMAILLALKVYAQGCGEKGRLRWNPVTRVIDALDEAFYASFTNVVPCNKPMLLALDVSGSMDATRIAGSCLTAREASAAMALITASTEPDCEIIAFSAPHGGGYGGQWDKQESGITRVNLSPQMRLDNVVSRLRAIPMGGTDCALPIIWAQRRKLRVSAFVTYTDNETWAGSIHPAQAIKAYRQQYSPDAKAVVVAMAANQFSIADPSDPGMLDVVGFDATAPAVIADFIRD